MVHEKKASANFRFREVNAAQDNGSLVIPRLTQAHQGVRVDLADEYGAARRLYP